MLIEKLNPKELELMQDYIQNARTDVRNNLIQMIENVDPNQKGRGADSWAYVFWNRQLDDRQVDFLLNFRLREAYYPSELAEKVGWTVPATAKMCEELAHIGILEVWSDENRESRYILPIFCVGSFEQAMMSDWRMKKFPEMSVAFTQYTTETCTTGGVYLPIANHGVHRVVPIETAIENEPKRARWEEISKLIEDSAEGSYGLARCVCRSMREERDEQSGETNFEWCLSLGHLADYLISTGKARRISREEFWDVLKTAEDRGFVHNISNANGTTPIEYVCNCDYHSCYTLRAANYTQNRGIVGSNFVAEVDPEKCMACGSCVETCPMNAVKLGQRLCRKSGSFSYEDSPSPAADSLLMWGPEHHDPDYLLHRDNTWSETGTAPCKSNCPAHIGIAAYMRLASQGKYTEALELIKKDNPFPAVCGSICNRRCEHVCTRGGIDDPIAIDEVKKFVAWQELHADKRFVPRKIHREGRKIAVIGGGPAGLSCAYYLAVYGNRVTVFEKEDKLGGMLRWGIPSFHLEKDIIDAEIEVLRELGVYFNTHCEIGRDYTIRDLREEGYEAFYIAIGAQNARRLGLENEDAEGVIAGIDFMKKVHLKDDFQLHGKVVVIGGGNVASDVARTAVRSGAEEVHLVCLEAREEMPASPDQIEEAEEEGVQVHCGWGPTSIAAEDGRLRGITFRRCVATRTEDGGFCPRFDESETYTQDADYILTCIGQSVRWGELLDGTDVKIRSNLIAECDPVTEQTAQPDIFVGGDVSYGPKFTIDAIASGKQGAESIHRYVNGHDLLLGRDRFTYGKFMDRDDVEFGEYDTAPRQKAAVDLAKKMSFRDERTVLTEEQVRAEASRCLRCGASHVDQGLCIGCGVCTTRCKFDAIHLKKVYDCTPVPREKLGADVMMEVGRRKAVCAQKAAMESA